MADCWSRLLAHLASETNGQGIELVKKLGLGKWLVLAGVSPQRKGRVGLIEDGRDQDRDVSSRGVCLEGIMISGVMMSGLSSAAGRRAGVPFDAPIIW